MVNPEIKEYGFGGKYRTKEEDDEYRSRIKGVPRKRVWTKDKCIVELEDILKHLKTILRDTQKVELGDDKKLKRECIRDLNTMMNRILDFMKYLYPPVQKSVNLNVDMISQKFMDRLKKYKEKQIVVFGEKENETI